MKTRGTRRRFVWLVMAGLTALMIVCCVVLTRWANQPRWRTYRFPADPKTGLVIAVDYPDNWSMIDNHWISRRTFPLQAVELKLRKQGGLAGWWTEHVLSRSSRSRVPPGLSFMVIWDEPESEFDLLERVEARSPAVISERSARVPNPLGPAREIKSIVRIQRNAMLPPEQVHQFFILPDRMKRHNLIVINYVGPEGAFPGGDARLQEIFRRVRLVSTTRGTTK